MPPSSERTPAGLYRRVSSEVSGPQGEVFIEHISPFHLKSESLSIVASVLGHDTPLEPCGVLGCETHCFSKLDVLWTPLSAACLKSWGAQCGVHTLYSSGTISRL